MVNMYSKFDVDPLNHANTKQVMILKSGGQTDGRKHHLTTYGFQSKFVTGANPK